MQCGQREAAAWMLILQYEQSLVADAAAGFGISRFTHLMSRKTAKATIRNSMMVFRKLPYPTPPS